MTKSRRAVLDIGANEGEFGLGVARRNPDLRIICVEPQPSMAKDLMRKAEAEGLSNIEVVEAALVDDGRTTVTLHMSDQETGTSSLLDFDESIRDDEYWKTRTGLTFDHHIEVAAMSLADLIERSELDEVIFAKIDVQGLDVEVLLSAGEQLSKIRAGMLEVPVLSHHRLYSDEVQTLPSAITLLEQNGFGVAEVKSNDPGINEVNVYFSAADVSLHDVESELRLRGTPIYDDKWLWALPCVDQVALDEAQRLPAEAEAMRKQLRDIRQEVMTAYDDVHKARVELEGLRVELTDCRSSLRAAEHAVNDARATAERERNASAELRSDLAEALAARDSALDVARTLSASAARRVKGPLRAVNAIVKR